MDGLVIIIVHRIEDKLMQGMWVPRFQQLSSCYRTPHLLLVHSAIDDSISQLPLKFFGFPDFQPGSHQIFNPNSTNALPHSSNHTDQNHTRSFSLCCCAFMWFLVGRKVGKSRHECNCFNIHTGGRIVVEHYIKLYICQDVGARRAVIK